MTKTFNKGALCSISRDFELQTILDEANLVVLFIHLIIYLVTKKSKTLRPWKRLLFQWVRSCEEDW